MAVFKFKAFTSNGKEISGQEEALSVEHLRSILSAKGFVVYEVEEIKEQAKKTLPSIFSKKVSESDLSLILYEMSVLYDKGVHITDIFEILSKQFEGSEIESLFIIAKSKVSEGAKVSEALKAMNIFPDFVIEMVSAGEESGALGKVLLSASKFIEESANFKEKVKGALTYPAIVMLIGFLSMIVVVKVAVPKIVKIYTQFGEKIPTSTKMILYFSSFLSLIFKIIPLILLISFLFKDKLFNKRRIDMLKLKLPFLKDVEMCSTYASWSNTLSVLLKGGMTFDKAVEVANKTIKNLILKEKFEPLVNWIREGKKAADYLKKNKVLPDAGIRLVEIGEETGELEEMFSLIASIYKKETEKLIQKFVTLLEPATLLILALFVAFFVFATILPIFNLSIR